MKLSELMKPFNEANARGNLNEEVMGLTDAVAVEGITWLACADGMISEALVCFDSYALMEGLGIARPT